MIYLSCIFIYGNTAMYSNRSFLILCDHYKYVHSKSLVCIYEIRQSTGYITRVYYQLRLALADNTSSLLFPN